MNNRTGGRSGLRYLLPAFPIFILAAGFLIADVYGTAWGGIEPLKSRRADVERLLGKPIDDVGEEGALRFKAQGGLVTVAFVDSKFVQSKKLGPEYAGTVRQVVLQHDNSSITPESMDLRHKSRFERQEVPNGEIFRDLRDGLVYTFIGGRLKTTYYTPSEEQWSRAQRRR